MKRFLYIAAALFAFCIAPYAMAKADSDSEYVNTDYKIEDFTHLVVNVPADIVFESGKPFLSIAGGEKAVSALEVNCSESKLEIKSKRKLRNIRKLSVILSTDYLDRLEINGTGVFECERGFSTDVLNCNANGACDIRINKLDADKVNVTVNGAGGVDITNVKCDGNIKITLNGAASSTLTGTCYSAELVINGAGEIDAKELSCDKVSTSVNGVGSIKTR